MKVTEQIVAERIAKKHPENYEVTISTGHDYFGPYISALVETEDERIHYRTDSAGRLRISKRTQLTPTYKSIRRQPLDSALIIRGGKYNGHYIIGCQGEGWLKTTTNRDEVTPIRRAHAKENQRYYSFHAQYCFRGIFEVVTL